MSGLLYKNFYVNRSSLIFTLVTQVFVSGTAILFCVFTGDAFKDEAAAREASLIFALLYYLGYLLPSILSGEVFRNDESRPVCSFVMSSPLGGKGHVASKYYYILIVYIAILFFDFFTDVVVMGMTGGMVNVSIVLVILFCYRMLLSAIEMPFMVRYGSEKGVQIKGAVISLIISLFMVYFLFGDISFLIDNDDPIEAFTQWLSTGDIITWIAVFPYLSIAAYYISYRISVRLYRKGAENYEQ